MFFNAHAYHSIKRNNNKVEPMRIMGALLADSALTGVIDWTDLHTNDSIDAFSKNLPESYRQLGVGLMDHHDLDLLSHDAYEGGAGYAYSRQTPELQELVAEACGLTSPEQTQQFTHNFIESGVDINLLAQDSSVQAEIRQAIAKTDIDTISTYISDFFGSNMDEVKIDLDDYIDLLTSYDLREIGGWVALWTDLIAILLGHIADEQAARQALLLAAELTADDYKNLLNV